MSNANSFYNYLNGMESMKSGRVIKVLSKYIRYNNKVYTYPDWIALKLQEGSIPQIHKDQTNCYKKDGEYLETKPKNVYALDNTDNTYNEINKTYYDFAVYLFENGAITKEKAEELKQIESDREEKEKAAETIRLENERLETEKREKDKEDFEIWLKTEADNYNNEDKINIVKSVFTHYHGGFNDRSIQLLVLIDNIDNPMCRQNLIEWLWYGNEASKKAFSLITGIKLPATDKETREILNTITSADYTESRSFKPRKAAEEKTEESYYKLIVTSPGKSEFVEIKAEPLNKYGLDLFIHKSGKNYYLSEAKTGLNFSNGETKTEVLKGLADVITRHGIEKVNSMINDAINKNGISPRYKTESEAV